MTVLFHPDAETEFNEAINYYDVIEVELGDDFISWTKCILPSNE